MNLLSITEQLTSLQRQVAMLSTEQQLIANAANLTSNISMLHNSIGVDGKIGLCFMPMDGVGKIRAIGKCKLCNSNFEEINIVGGFGRVIACPECKKKR